MHRPTLKQQVYQFVAGRKVRGVTYRDIHRKFPGTSADRRLRELFYEENLVTVNRNGHVTYYVADR